MTRKTAEIDDIHLSISGLTVDRRKMILYLVSSAQGLEIMGISIVTIALPSIGAQFGLSEIGLQWVISAYALTIAGFMLLGGRLADLFGRTRVFTGGLAVFALSSLVTGVAPSSSVLFVGRALQGLGMAITIPATLSIVTTLYPKGPKRARALATYTIIDSVGFITGFVASGVLVSVAGWRSVFLINIPIAIVLAVGVWKLADHRDSIEMSDLRGLDLPGAAIGTSGLILMAYALTQAQLVEWTSRLTGASVAGATILLSVFVTIEARANDPLVPLRLFLIRSFIVANVVGIFLYAVFLGSMYFATLYLQDILGYSAFFTGVAFLPLAVGVLIMTLLSSRMLTHLGAKWMIVIGMGLTAISLLWFSRLAPDSTYWMFGLPIFLLLGGGMSMTFVSVMSAGVMEIQERDHGVASGVLNSAFQVGTGLGPAILVTVAEVGESTAASDGLRATLAGFELALVVGGILAAIGALVGLAVPQSQSQKRNDSHQTTMTD